MSTLPLLKVIFSRHTELDDPTPSQLFRDPSVASGAEGFLVVTRRDLTALTPLKQISRPEGFTNMTKSRVLMGTRAVLWEWSQP